MSSLSIQNPYGSVCLPRLRQQLGGRARGLPRVPPNCHWDLMCEKKSRKKLRSPEETVGGRCMADSHLFKGPKWVLQNLEVPFPWSAKLTFQGLLKNFMALILLLQHSPFDSPWYSQNQWIMTHLDNISKEKEIAICPTQSFPTFPKAPGASR